MEGEEKPEEETDEEEFPEEKINPKYWNTHMNYELDDLMDDL